MIGHSKQMAKRGLETYCLYMRETLQEKGLKEKFKSGDEEKIENVVQATLDWLRQLDKNKLAEEGECEAKQRELDGVVNPIMDGQSRGEELGDVATTTVRVRRLAMGVPRDREEGSQGQVVTVKSAKGESLGLDKHSPMYLGI